MNLRRTQLQSTAYLEFRIHIWRQENSHRDGKLNNEWSLRPSRHVTKMERAACDRYSSARKAEGREHIQPRVGSLPSVQFRSVTQSCLTLCNPMNRTMPGLPVHHQLPEFTQTHVHRVSSAIQPSHPLLSPSPPAPSPSQHQGLFQ